MSSIYTAQKSLKKFLALLAITNHQVLIITNKSDNESCLQSYLYREKLSKQLSKIWVWKYNKVHNSVYNYFLKIKKNHLPEKGRVVQSSNTYLVIC